MKTVKELLDSKLLNVPEKWSEDLKIGLPEFQSLHHWIGSIWDDEMSEVEIYAKAVQIVPNMTVIARFFDRPRATIEFCVGIFADATAYITRMMNPEDIVNLKREVRDLSEHVEKLGFRVRHRGIKPEHDEAKESEYRDCDLQDMVLLMKEAEEEDHDSFYHQWDLLLEESSVSEILDVMPEILTSDSKHAVARWDEAFHVLKQRAPFEQIYAHLNDFEATKERHGHALDKTSEGEYPADYANFKEYTWEMFKRLHSILSAFNPRMEKLLEDGREDAKKVSGFRP